MELTSKLESAEKAFCDKENDGDEVQREARRGADGRFRRRGEDGRLSEEERRMAQDADRCRQVEDALYRRARGYKVALKKTFKVKRAEFDGNTGKKLTEREELETGVEEVHIPADVRVCAYYLNNRDPARWREHPSEQEEEILGGTVDFPPMAEVTELPEAANEAAVAADEEV